MLKAVGDLQFGEFTLDRHARELRRQGYVQPVTGKAFDLLSYMAANAGRPLTKSELLDAVWPGTTVEESNLSQNVFLLRKALGGDSPIKTLPGLGYQFAAQVTEVALEAGPAVFTKPASLGGSAVSLEATHTRVVVEDEVEERIAVSWLPIGLAFVAIVTLLGCGLLVYRRYFKAAVPTPVSQARPAIAVLGFRDFSHHPEQAWLSTAVAEMLASEMSADDKLRVIPGEELARAQADLGLKDAPVDSEAKRVRLRQAIGADVLVQGSYVVLTQTPEPSLRLMVKVVDAHSGKQLASLSETGRLDELFTLVDRAGGELRKDLAPDGSPSRSQAEDEQALSAMSHSTEALRFYAEGLERERAFDAHSAQSLFERAIADDPKFALAHLGLADVWADLGFRERANKEAAEAYKLSTDLPRAERLAVEADTRKFANDNEKAINLYKSLIIFYPDDQLWAFKLAAVQQDDGRQKEALSTLEQLRKLPLTPAEMVELDGMESVAYAYLDDPQANEKARALLQNAVTIADTQGGMFIHGRAFRWRCFALSHIGPVPTALAACERSKAAFQAIGNLAGVESATNNLGVLEQQAGNWKQAEQDYEDARRLDHQLGNLESEVDTIQNLAMLDLSQGELARALKESIELSQITGTGDDHHTAYEGHHFASATLLLLGRLPEARVEALKAQQSADKEHPWDYKVYQQARSRDDRAWVAYRAGDLTQARALFEQALTLVEPTHDDTAEAEFTADQAWVALGQGKPGSKQMDRLRRAAGVLAKLQDETDRAIDADVILARLDLQQGARDEAAQAIAKAKKLDSQGDSLDAHLDVLLGDADLQQSLGHTAEARRVLQDEIAAAKGHGFGYSDLAGEIALAKLDAGTTPSPQNASRLRALALQAERAGFNGLAAAGRAR
jgi:DNA-binding winged helix-turn-helix (wHTH) protein/tetratricopeptide (TPR) repeat protein